MVFIIIMKFCLPLFTFKPNICLKPFQFPIDSILLSAEIKPMQCLTMDKPAFYSIMMIIIHWQSTNVNKKKTKTKKTDIAKQVIISPVPTSGPAHD